MRRSALVIISVQALLTGCAVLMSVWAKSPWLATIGFAGLGVSAIASEVTARPPRSQFWKWSLVAAWICTLIVPVSLLFMHGNPALTNYLHLYYATLAWLIAGVMLPASHRLPEPVLRVRWKIPVMAWASSGCAIWVATAYRENLALPFFVGLVIGLALLSFCHIWFRLPFFGVQAVNTLILLVIGLPLADVLLHPRAPRQINPARLSDYYSYEAASKDPEAFRLWWEYLREHLDLMKKDVLLVEPGAAEPFRLRANSRGMFLRSPVAINRKGFRGREIPDKKGNVYRIVALGESTTFGLTLNPEDRPWPELLEQFINERLQPARPVEVINAGVPGTTLENNLHRLPRDILPLQPDMIISYHGYNGFHLLDSAIPPASGTPPPAYCSRPLRILADVEYALKMAQYKKRRVSKLFFHKPDFSNVMDTEYAKAYRDLIQIAQTNHIQLALATYSMAVNSASDSRVFEFYRPLTPGLYWYVKANEGHSRLIRNLAAGHPEIGFVDTQPQLDGHPAKFIDLMHFSPEGERQIAERMYAGIKNLLETSQPGLADKR